MNKKTKKTKILRNLGDGWAIKEHRKYKVDYKNSYGILINGVRKLETSSIHVYFGKKIVSGPHKNLAEAICAFEGEKSPK